MGQNLLNITEPIGISLGLSGLRAFMQPTYKSSTQVGGQFDGVSDLAVGQHKLDDKAQLATRVGPQYQLLARGSVRACQAARHQDTP